MRRVLPMLTLVLVIAGPLHADDPRYFAIEVVDAQTGRGVPLIELRTTNDIRHVTDSAGLVAFHEPGLMDRDVFFFVSGHGYRFPADGFDIRGTTLRTTPGGSARLEVERLNIAERLYRVTGQGIYRDSVMLGRRAPIDRPLLNGRVMGQDSVLQAVYDGKIYWFWGDTARESYALGHFATAGATSPPPGPGRLDPALGVNLTYFVDDQGFSRPMAPLPEPGMVWLDGLLTLDDDTGQTRMLCHYARMKSLGERLGHGLMVFNDQTRTFERTITLRDDAPLHPRGHPLRVTHDDGDDYFYFATPYPMTRVRAIWAAVTDPAAYEAFTCLEPGTRYDTDDPRLERDAAGRAVWAWKRDTDFIDPTRQKELIDAGALGPDEAWIDTRDAESGELITLHGGSVAWNPYRGRWIMIAVEIGGTSLLGEVWYAEADTPHGPWPRAVKVVTHDDYSFYNPRHHPVFDQDGGRLIYFEGTYTHTFSGTLTPTPRYSYNQAMYRLDLSDPRLRLGP